MGENHIDHYTRVSDKDAHRFDAGAGGCHLLLVSCCN